MDNLHEIQMNIIRALTFKPGLRFSELNSQNISSDQFSYHLRTLVEQGYVAKNGNQYSLTAQGKLYSSHMDTAAVRIERLPKTSVLIIPTRKITSKTEFLIQTRNKEPYFGYSGFITGKIRYGETVGEAAKRELLEEAGVEGESFQHHFVLHEMVYNLAGEQLEDKFFYVISCQCDGGSFVAETEDGKNAWVDESTFRNTSPLFHNELDLLDWYLEGGSGFREEKYYIEQY